MPRRSRATDRALRIGATLLVRAARVPRPHLDGGARFAGWRARRLDELRGVLALLAPGPCSLCGSDLPGRALASTCAPCWTALPLLVDPACGRCGLPRGAGDARRGPPPHECTGRARLERVVAAFAYDDGAVTLHRRLKFDGAGRLAEPLGRAMALAWRLRAPFAPDLCVAVPADRSRLPPRRLATRRLARAAASRLGLPLARRALTKPRATRPQTGRRRDERARALRGAFRADPRQVGGRCVLVVDDVATTGATLAEAARALSEAGARRVAALVLARTPAPGYRRPVPA